MFSIGLRFVQKKKKIADSDLGPRLVHKLEK